MAQKKRSTKKKKPANTQRKKQPKSPLRTEVQYLLIFLGMVLVTMGVFLHTSMGAFGRVLYEVFIGLFGFSAYLICIYMIVVMGMWMLGKLDSRRKVKAVTAFFSILLVSIFLHVFNVGSATELMDLYHKATPKTGGLIGGLLGTGLLKILGKTGSIILLSGLAIICLVILTERSALKAAGKATGRAADSARKMRDRQKEKHSLRMQRQETPPIPEEDPSQSDPIVVRGVGIEPSLEHKKPTKKRKREARAPIEDGTVDIPLLENDPYRQRKKKTEAQGLPESESKYVSEPEEDAIPFLEEEWELEPLIPETPAPAPAPKPAPSSGRNRQPLTEPSQNGTAGFAEQGQYQFPPIDLLSLPKQEVGGSSKAELMKSAQILEQSLMSFGVEAKVVQVNRGPAVTRYELQPKQGVKVSRIVNLADDIALNLAASGIRIEAPIPGKSAVGIEVPNKEAASVSLREVIESDVFKKFPSKLAFGLGKDIDGEVRVADIAKMPHLLIAGATGSGKSACINSLIISLLYKADPKEVKLILVDPKVVELSVYNGIPHLLIPVVNDPKKAAASLNWAVQEMTQRYRKFADMNVRDIRGYNTAVKEQPELELETLPQIVIIIDELADLMMVASKEVEEAICRLAQMARAAGLHLVIATQRPSVDVITGLIKANIPSRLAFAVSSGTDSRTILDMVGAEKLLGKGDMLFCPMGASKPTRIQGAFVSDKEVETIVAAVRVNASYDEDLIETVSGGSVGGTTGEDDELDEILPEAISFVVDKQKASISMLQRAFRIGFNRAARLMEAMYARGIVGPDEGSKPRKVLITREELESDGEE